MAQVTVELRHLIEQTDFELFDFDYPVTDPNFKAKLEEDVTEYFYSYEIGFETPDMFKQKFRAKFRRIMTYYNDLYNTTLLEYNPLINYKMSELMEQLTNTDNSENSTQDLTSNTQTTDDNTRTDNLTTTSDATRTDNLTRAIDENSTTSDYPQQPIAGGSYASGAGERESTENNTGTVLDEGTTTQTGTVLDEGTGSTNRTDNTTSNRTGTSSVNMDYEKTIEGLTGTSYQELIAKERESILRISNMIIAELKTLFILVY